MEILYTLALLACPVGMGAMMWFMMRGTKRGGEKPRSAADLRAEQHRLDAEIERLERAESRGLDGRVASGR